MIQGLFAKIYFFFLSPAYWIIVLLIVAWVAKKANRRKVCVISSVVILLLFGNQVLYNCIMKQWQPKPVNLKGKTYEVGIVLGGMSWVDENNVGFFRKSGDRYIQTEKLYRQGVIKKIIVSAGGTQDLPNEAVFVKRQLVETGIPAADIISEERSGTTYENATFSKQIIDTMHVRGPYVLITSAFHMYRAERVFRKAGIAVVPYPCDYDVVNVRQYFTDYFLPNIEVLDKWKYLLKEWIGVVAYRLSGKL